MQPEPPKDGQVVSPYTGVSKFLPSTRRISQFADGSRDPKPTDKIVYCDGAWDVFHPGRIFEAINFPGVLFVPIEFQLHFFFFDDYCLDIAFLEHAKKQGDWLIVGVFPDDVVSRQKGGDGVWPIMNMWERVLGVLSCKFVDEVLIAAPWDLTEEILQNHKISVVVSGKLKDEYAHVKEQDWHAHYAAAKKMGIFKEIDSGSKLNTTQVVHRIVAKPTTV